MSSASSYGIGDVVRSEWTKLTSLRSIRWTFAAFPLVGMVLGIVSSAAYGSNWSPERESWDPTNNTLAGLIPGYLLIPVLGVLVMSSEFTTGAISSTFSAVPKRSLVLTAKAAVFGAVVFVLDEVVTFAAFLAGQQAMGDAPHARIGDPGVLRALVLSGAFLALMGVFGLGLGAIVRHSGAAIATYAGLVLVLPMILLPLPGNAWRFGPLVILGNSVAAAEALPGMLSPWTGFAVMALYAGVALVAGGICLVRRDA